MLTFLYSKQKCLGKFKTVSVSLVCFLVTRQSEAASHYRYVTCMLTLQRV